MHLLLPLVGSEGEVETGLQHLGRIGRDDRFERANCGLKDLDAIEKPRQDAFVNRALVHEVDDEDGLFLLADAIDSADPLLDLHGIPWQVVIDYRRTEFEVQAFAGNPDSRVRSRTHLHGSRP